MSIILTNITTYKGINQEIVRVPERPTAHCFGRGQVEQHCKQGVLYTGPPIVKTQIQPTIQLN